MEDNTQRRRERLARMAPGLASAAVCAEGAYLSGSASAVALAAAVAAGSAAGLLAFAWKRLGRSGRFYGVSVAAYAALWAGEVSAHGGPFWAGSGWLITGAALLAAPWSYRRRWKWEPAEPEALPVPQFEEISEFRKVWLGYAAVPGSPFEDCDLTPEWDIPGGKQADIILPRGVKSTEDAIGGIRRLLSAWDTDPTKLFVEETPDGKRTRARLTVLERDVLAEKNLWTGPTLDPSTGTVRAGRFPDGQPVHAQFWSPGSGATDIFVCGTKGSGKSELLGLLCGELHLSQFAVPWVSDPQEGQCLPDFIGRVGRYAIGGDGDVEDNMRMIRAYRRIIFRRSRYFGREIEWIDSKGRERKGGKRYFDPTETDIHGTRIPLLYLFLDEQHALARHPVHGKEAVSILGDVSRIDRKAGGGKAYVAHQPSQAEMGGHNAAIIRLLLKEGTTFALRTGEAVDRTMLNLPIDPSKLPERFADGSKTHGLGIVKGGPDNRCTQFRADLNPDTYATAQMPAGCELDAMSAEAAAMPDDPERAPKHFPVPGIPRVAVMPSAEERKTMAERILPLLADGQDHAYGSILKALPQDVKERTVRHGLKQLVDERLVWTAGPKQPYRITDAGRAELERRGVAA